MLCDIIRCELWDSSVAERRLIGTAEISLLPLITVTTGHFSGDVQVRTKVGVPATSITIEIVSRGFFACASSTE